MGPIELLGECNRMMSAAAAVMRAVATVSVATAGVRVVVGREETGIDVLCDAADGHRRRCAQALPQGLLAGIVLYYIILYRNNRIFGPPTHPM